MIEEAELDFTLLTFYPFDNTVFSARFEVDKAESSGAAMLTGSTAQSGQIGRGGKKTRPQVGQILPTMR